MNNLCQFSQAQLLDYIDKVSFAVNDIILFLDSHPDCQEALAYFHEHSEMRNAALEEYARRFGPLTLDTVNDTSSNRWEWNLQKWPWEGGNCSCGTTRNGCNTR